MDETLNTSEKIAEIYQPNNTIEYVAVMFVIAFALWLFSKYMMSKKESSPSDDVKESIKDLKEYLKGEIDELKDDIKEIRYNQISDGKKLERDYERLNTSDDKFKTLFEHMNESQKDVAEIKGRLA